MTRFVKSMLTLIMDMETKMTKDKQIKQIKELEERVAALERGLAILSNTLHVVDAAALLSVNSLIKTGNLHPLTFASNQDIIDSGCSKAIEDALANANLVFKNERNKHGKEDEPEGR